MYEQKCKELEEKQTDFETLTDNFQMMESSRDRFRSQFLELREFNKELELEVKSNRKSANAQIRSLTDQLNKFGGTHSRIEMVGKNLSFTEQDFHQSVKHRRGENMAS